jgi:hypothetical protein
MTRRVGPWPTIRNMHIASVSNEAERGALRHSLFVIIAPMAWACGFVLRWARGPPYLLVHLRNQWSIGTDDRSGRKSASRLYEIGQLAIV